MIELNLKLGYVFLWLGITLGIYNLNEYATNLINVNIYISLFGGVLGLYFMTLYSHQTTKEVDSS